MKTTAFCIDDRGAFCVRAAFTPFARVTGIGPVTKDLLIDDPAKRAAWSLSEGQVVVEMNDFYYGGIQCVIRAAG